MSVDEQGFGRYQLPPSGGTPCGLRGDTAAKPSVPYGDFHASLLRTLDAGHLPAVRSGGHRSGPSKMPDNCRSVKRISCHPNRIFTFAGSH